MSAGEGSKKGERLYEWVCLGLEDGLEEVGMRRWLLVRRDIDEPDKQTFYLAYAPAGTSIRELARTAGKRWKSEECFEQAKGESGLDEYEVSKWDGWYHHVIDRICVPHRAIARQCHKASHRTKRAGRRDARRESGSEPTGTAAPTTPTAFHHKQAKDGGSLTDAEWERVSELLPEHLSVRGAWGAPDRQVLGGILWVLNTGASWRELPEEEFGPNSTAHGRYRKWCKEGLWSRIVQALGR